MEQTKGFFGSLFDFSFTALVTSKVIKILYGLSIVGAAFVAIAIIVGAFNNSVGLGLVTLIIGAPLLFLIYVIYARVLLEIIIVIFRIMEHTAEIVEQGRRGSS